MDTLTHDRVKSNAVDPASLLANRHKDDAEAGKPSGFHAGLQNNVGRFPFTSRMYRACCISLTACLFIAGMCCLFKSSDMTLAPAAVTSAATSSPHVGDLHDNTPTHYPAPSVNLQGNHDQSSNDHRLPRIQIKPYRDTGIRLPVLPNYGSPETARLGCDHVYVIHKVGHPDRLARMVRLLQLLRISAEFVPVMQPPEALLQAHMSSLHGTDVPSLENIIEWHTRHRIYRDMAEQGYRSALILDDSVDMELNIKTIMRAIHRHIPADWDMLFPGHCGAFEGIQPRPSPDALPSLRLANMPICLHAHAISRKGLMRLLHSLPPLPTSNEIIGMAIMRLKEQGLLKMYSVDTPVFAPRPAEHDSHEERHLAGNKKLGISAVDHLALWQGQNKQEQRN